MPSFADMVAYLRKRAGYSQTELADKLKISRSAIGMYESGKREPDFETLEALADTFNVTYTRTISCRRSVAQCSSAARCAASEYPSRAWSSVDTRIYIATLMLSPP